MAKRGKSKPNGRAADSGRSKKSKGTKPRSQPLPGMDRVRSGKLDNICEGIGDERETMNKARTEEKNLILSALKVMQEKNISVYKHAKIELARVPGAEKLRVRMVKEEGDAGEEDLEVSDAEETETAEEETPF